MKYTFINSENDVVTFSGKSESEAIEKLRDMIEDDAQNMCRAFNTYVNYDEWIEETFNDYKLKNIRLSWCEKLQNLFK